MPEEQSHETAISSGKPQADYIYYLERERTFRRRFWICLVLSIPVLLYSPVFLLWLDSPAVHTWLRFSIPPFPGSVWATSLFALLVFFYGSAPFLRLAVDELRRYRPGMMTFLSLLIIAVLVYSLSTLVRDCSPSTFLIDATGAVLWPLVVLIDVLLLNHWIGLRRFRQASHPQGKLAQLMPATVERIAAKGKTEEVTIDELQGSEPILAHPKQPPSAHPTHPPVQAEATAEELTTDPERGLSEDEVARRQEKYGLNRLRRSQRRSAWQIFFDQFKSIVVILLAIAAALAFAFAQWAEGVAILAVLMINGAVGSASEWRAHRSMEALQKRGVQRVRVRRQGQERMTAAEKLVPGDIVLLKSGDIVAADLRLIEADSLRANEAALTGESVPTKKQVEPVEADRPLAERYDMLFKGTAVAEGSALGMVVSTGMRTELGKIFQLVAEAKKEATPLEERLNQLGQRLAWITIIIAAVVAGAGLLAGQPTLLMIETAIALGVAAIPEGLPIVATIALAQGMRLMARRQALINHLTAVETLGATHVICTDKTGTLTENRMILQRVVTPLGEYPLDDQTTRQGNEDPLLQRVLEVSVLCNNASLGEGGGHGDPTEVALLQGGRQFGLIREQLLAQKPEAREVSFNSELMMMATYHKSEDGFEVAIKGAPGAVLEACDTIPTEQGKTRPLSEEDRKAWRKRTEALASQGLRLLAIADKRVKNSDIEPYTALRFLGLVGLLDPPRQGVREAINACQGAGIRVVMITGDQPETAKAIARQVGLVKDEERPILHGRELNEPQKLSEENRQRILETEIFARVNPTQKLYLIEIFQDRGYTVAMTGDGVNDTPALKKADIGVAMGQRGTDAARQAADMALKDDSLSSIVAAVEQGRIIFGNIRKSVMFMLCTNVAEILAVTLASLAHAPIPLSPLQILYLNILTDAWPALALGVGKGDPQIMQHPPRNPEEAVLTRSHWQAIGGWSILIAACVLSALALALLWADFGQLKAVTISFLTLGFAKLWFVLNLRSPGTRLLNNDIVLNPWIWISIAFCIALLVLAVYLPGLSDLLQTWPLTGPEWILVLSLSLVPMLVGQALRAFQRYFANTVRSDTQQRNSEKEIISKRSPSKITVRHFRGPLPRRQ